MVSVAPMMNLRGLSQLGLVQDRYVYLASVGWCVMLAYWATSVAALGVFSRRLVWGAAASLLIACFLALWRVQHFWRDEMTAYAAAVEASPGQAVSHYNLGMELKQHGDLIGAERELRKSLSLKPVSAALYDLGVVHARLGRVKEAAGEEAQGLKLMPYEPADAYIGLAELYDLNGDQPDAEATLKHVESMAGGVLLARLARAQISFNHGQVAKARAILQDLAASDPKDPRVWTMMGIVATSQKRNGEALSDYMQALALVPDDTFTRLMAALTLHRMGRETDAREQCRVLLAISPNDPNGKALMRKIEQKIASQQVPTPGQPPLH